MCNLKWVCFVCVLWLCICASVFRPIPIPCTAFGFCSVCSCWLLICLHCQTQLHIELTEGGGRWSLSHCCCCCYCCYCFFTVIWARNNLLFLLFIYAFCFALPINIQPLFCFIIFMVIVSVNEAFNCLSPSSTQHS